MPNLFPFIVHFAEDCKDDRKFSCDEKVSLTVSPKEHRSSLKDRDSGKSSTDSFISKLSAQFGSNITAVLPDEDDHSNFSPMMHDNDESLLKLSEAFVSHFKSAFLQFANISFSSH